MKTSKDLNEKGKLGVFAIWAIGVGMVISGESFGWNLGWAKTGPIWFFVPVIFAALLYFCLVQNLIELTCVYPEAMGPHEYVRKAFGRRVGAFVAIALLFEFLFATPAIASSLGEYLGFLMGDLAISRWISTLFLLAFSIVNLFDVHIGVRFLILLTLLAVVELLLYQGAIVDAFSMENIGNANIGSLDFTSFIAAMPYAVWLFLAIEGISLLSNNIDKVNLRRNLSKGYNYAFFTLLLLAVSVLLLAAGGIDWNTPESRTILSENHPMPASIALILGKGHLLVQIFTFIGLFGLIASLQGIALAATAQLESLMPWFRESKKLKRTISSSIVFLFSLIAIWSSQTGFLIEVSVFGAVCMYVLVSGSLLKLRSKSVKRTQPNSQKYNPLHSEFNRMLSPLYGWVALLISLICVFSFAYVQFSAFIIFLVCGFGYSLIFYKK